MHTGNADSNGTKHIKECLKKGVEVLPQELPKDTYRKRRISDIPVDITTKEHLREKQKHTTI